MKWLISLSKNKSFLFLGFTSVIFFLLRLPSLFEPYWYGDEGIYEVIGKALRQGRILYSGIWDNKPPLLYITYALANGDQTAAKFLSAIAGILSLIFFYNVAKLLFKKDLTTYYTTGFFACLLALPVMEGNIANAENFLLVSSLIGMFFLLRYTLKQKLVVKSSELFILGIIFSISFLYKIVGVFDFIAACVFLVLVLMPKTNKKLFTPVFLKTSIQWLLPLVTGFILPVIMCCLFFLFHHAFSDFFYATILSNFGYVSYGNMFIIPQGFLLFKVVLLLMSLFFIIRFRKVFSLEQQFIFIWLAFSVFNVYFSQRPYTHYTLLLLPAFSLLLGMFIEDKKERVLSSIIFLIILLLVGKTFHFYSVKKTIAYYTNFTSFIAGQKSVTAYQNFFDHNTPRDYALASYVRYYDQQKEPIFMWGDSAQIYALSQTLPPGKYTVSYHITQYKNALFDTQKALLASQPLFIVILPNTSNFPFSLYNYRYKLTTENTQIYERIQKNP